MWCGPGFSKTDEGSSLDSYRFNGSQVPCWYDEGYDSSANSGNPDAQDTTVKFVQCSEDWEGYVETIVTLGSGMGLCFIGMLVGCCAFCIKSKKCDNCGDFCHSSGKCAKKISKYVFCCKCCPCCHKKYWDESSSDAPRTEYEQDNVGVHIDQYPKEASQEPIPSGMKQSSPVYTAAADHQEAAPAAEEAAAAPPLPPVPPPTGNLERTASAQVSQNHGVTQLQARQMINQGVVEVRIV